MGGQEDELSFDAINDSISSSEEEDGGKKKKRIFRVSLRKGKFLKFKLVFGPMEVRNYNFEFPIALEGYGKIDGLKRSIKCIGDKKPRFLISPTTIEFDKKIITSADKSVPDCKDIILTNLSHQPLQWRIDESKLRHAG